MPSWDRDPNAPAPNRPRKVGVCFIVELDGGVLIDRRSDDGALAFTGGTLGDDKTGDAYLDFDGTPVVA